MICKRKSAHARTAVGSARCLGEGPPREIGCSNVARDPKATANRSRPVVSAADRADIALNRVVQNSLCIRWYDPLEEVAVDPVELERRQRCADRPHPLFR